MANALNNLAFIVGTHADMYRPMEVAQIVGMVTLCCATRSPRVVFEVIYADGKTDQIPVEPAANYQILTANEVCYGLKKVTDPLFPRPPAADLHAAK